MPIVGIKFVEGGKVFNVETSLEIEYNTQVVVDTIRGIELAIACNPSKKDETQDEVSKIIRIATENDIKNAKELEKQVPKIFSVTNELIAKYKLEMKLVSVSFTLDGSKVIINYVCEDRVDFRELVKDLASQFKLRIELRQIGIRDQAKIVGGIGFCGKECCCKKYLNDFDKVSIKMAKSQGLSLNPTKISGICGRLMCCLSYENEYYSEISVKMPKINGRVKTKDGIGVAVYNNLLKQKVTVKIENNGEIKLGEYDLNDIEILPKLSPENTPKKDNFQNKDNNSIEKENKQDKSMETNENKEKNKISKQKKHHKFNKNNGNNNK